MDYWKILGIKPTSDKALIKKAFAQKVKINPPSKDAQKYQELREAYDWVMKQDSSKIFMPKAFDDLLDDDSFLSEEDDDDTIDSALGKNEAMDESISLAELSRLRTMFGSISFKDIKTAIGSFPYRKISFAGPLLYEHLWKNLKLLKTFALLFIMAVIALVRCLLICSEQ
ncbi:J domain-containing protein [Treponema sp.]|uniref:J domain-containing protein n=1 Tax=Treponema sp. TaxID=166 RepID=UPI00388F5550